LLHHLAPPRGVRPVPRMRRQDETGFQERGQARPGGEPMSVQWKLGLIAGATVFLGLLVAKLPRVSRKTTGFLTAISTGILIFIMVEIMAGVTEGLEE